MDHEATYGSWFLLADEDNDGRLTGADAVRFFTRSGLAKESLAKIWSIADSTRQGYLGKNEFLKAMTGIALVQNNIPLSLETVNEAVAKGSGAPVAFMDGLKVVLETDRSNNFTDPFSKAYKGPAHQESRRRANGRVDGKAVTSIVDGLKRIYMEKIKPLEVLFKFDSFYGPVMTDSDFEAKPSVLLLGQYSTGKTTFIKHLLQREYPGAHIGPEPTTDRFVVVMGGVEERRTPGNTLAVQTDKPFSGLTKFGTAFLSKFESAQCDSPLLQEITLVDTPGVLSGEKQRIDRSYDFINVCQWFANRCDIILLLFDPHKLDISDEFKAVIASLKGHDDKVRVVLNKADQVDMQQLMRVYGALMWSLGKVFGTPEVCRVYVGSFNTEPINTAKNPVGEQLFLSEQGDLIKDLYDIPHRSCDRKVNEFVKRVRAARIHALIISHLKKQMPSMMGKQKAQDKLIANLEEEFYKVQLAHQLPVGDFPPINKFRETVRGFDFSKFPKLDKRIEDTFTQVLNGDIPDLLKSFDNPF
uniref:Uncharacterized protein n=1 Tax=Pyramimonas obovata TaxID=1411642 RepID=A0A7S0QT92_9CHLO|mmetsp:Transcript_13704/g.29265  ORF Transcript_13704/g.29265 Transcript_13704/m.29265 type:complete len:528 (+) Transcript_13704:306-1889(+)|eukprot:CAMPEP_0118933478 /NCGR_PEP_ID=MMETSP1169-20130426/12007_1 /TAXON_ID=36882 /ORGANISM="Pyramimonas obovata, Strain CCMP722" /LENGTH=527 /DNA_ID=CAMNT_0006876239 /DNA_START=305 /DNA_END=1888 /DNA_ORIENTATION=-